uniref:Putative ovule protein n=1 Tax=Solanum chacoense TaxID=4108 RepID=A0A0V0HK10_SOLCH
MQGTSFVPKKLPEDKDNCIIPNILEFLFNFFIQFFRKDHTISKYNPYPQRVFISYKYPSLFVSLYLSIYSRHDWELHFLTKRTVFLVKV